ncbi:M23 family metallopeptidase [Novosphingobium sp.]|uniref:M23 family metallopeptidase n=1 Tax=Novosphingobium sp. TaxID=1874826 RepID=UPI003B52A70E
MSFIGSDTAQFEPRGFGRALPGQAGTRRSALSHADVRPALLPASLRDWPHPLARIWDRWCRRIETRFAGQSLAVDLRDTIGSRNWFAGLARLIALATLALACMPRLTPFEASPLPLPGDSERSEFHAQAIAPLITGGATGRHFAATNKVVRLDSVPERATIALDAVLGENDDLAHMLQRIGLTTGDADAVKAMVTPLGPPVPGTRFAITLGPRASVGEARPLQSLTFRPRYDLDASIVRQGGGLTLIKHDIPVDTTPVHLVAAAGSSLYRSARAAGAAPETVQAYLQAIDQYLPFEAIAPTDQFELVVSHKQAIDGTRGGSGQDGELLYAGVLREGKPLLRVMRWGKDGNFFTPEAFAGSADQGSGSGLLAAPVAGNITSWFGYRRHPILGYVRLHAGVDFGAPYGTPIFAVTDGAVIYAGWHGGHGNYVRLTHGGGTDTAYGHMSRIAVAMGQHVSRGQVIGYVGATGLATGPHLHYELYRNGQPVDPLSMRFVPHHSQVDPGELASFRAKMNEYLALPRLGTPARG